MSWHRIGLTLGLVAFLFTLVSAADAQDRGVVFVHGLKSSGDTWEAAAASLQAQLALESRRPTQTWNDTYEAQAEQLHSAIGLFGGFSTVAVGHSNGGIVSREWSKWRTLGGVVTVGTPHHGAPILENLLNYVDFNATLSDRIAGVFDGFGHCFGTEGCEWGWVIFQDSLNDLLAGIWGYVDTHLLELASTLGITLGPYPIFGEMVPSAPYLADLNSSSNLSREQGEIGTRVGVVSIARNFFDAGFVRVFNPEAADTVDTIKDYVVLALDFWGGYLLGSNDPNAQNTAAFMFAAAGRLAALDEMYCKLVSSVGMTYCEANDEVVPFSSQRYPGAQHEFVMDQGPVHIRETTESTPTLYQTLTTWLNIGPRSSGGPMTSSSAITGCSGWSWLDPVYKPDADSCYSYCQQYLADACEWSATQNGASNPGDCYVEYGDGCSVTPGYSGWSAAVLNLGGPPSGGGGGGDGQMHADSAVRGCTGWWWWDPVYEPSATACAEFCVNNGADACEWYENGDCYVEFGSGCYIQPGYPGWSAMVLN